MHIELVHAIKIVLTIDACAHYICNGCAIKIAANKCTYCDKYISKSLAQLRLLVVCKKNQKVCSYHQCSHQNLLRCRIETFPPE